MVFCEDYQETREDKIAIQCEAAISLIIFSVLVGAITHNAVMYVGKQGLYKVRAILLLYFFIMLTVVCKIFGACILLSYRYYSKISVFTNQVS